MTARFCRPTLAILSALLFSAPTFANTAADLQAQGLTPLTDDSIREVTQGNTLDHKMIGTRLVAPIYYGSNGMRTVNATAFGGRISSTKWWVENGHRCEISARTQQTQCGLIFKQDDTYTVCFNGEESCKWTFTVRAGNPDKLSE